VTVVRRLIGVYDADGTLRGEIAYWVGARLGRTHCSLCEITHGAVRVRPEWTECRSSLPVPFDTFHRDDQPPAVRDAAGGRAPVVVAETDDGVVVLLDDEALEACGGSVDRLADALSRAVADRGLAWP
jgi:phage terminase large subunit-like protein